MTWALASLASAHPPGPISTAWVPTASSVVGGSTGVAIAAIVTFFVAVGLSLLVTYRVIEGYRGTRQPEILYLAVGIFLLAPAPMLFRFLLVNLTGVPIPIRSLVASGSELAGLGFILYTVYSR